jgi:hypothetical protein
VNLCRERVSGESFGDGGKQWLRLMVDLALNLDVEVGFVVLPLEGRVSSKIKNQRREFFRCWRERD